MSMFQQLRTIFRSIFLVFAAVAICSVAQAQSNRSSRHVNGLRENKPAVFALVNARIVTQPGRVIERGTVLIRNGKIADVGSDVNLSDSARIIDLAGHTIYPGLIDAFAEAEITAPRPSSAYWNNNIHPERSVAAALPDLADQNKVLREQGICAQLVAPQGLIIKGQSALVLTNSADGNESLLAGNVAQHLRLTVDRARRSNGVTRDPNSPMGAVALARQTLYDAGWFAAAWKAVKADRTLPRPEMNSSLAALQPILNGQQVAIVDAPNERMFLNADRFAREFGLNIIVRGSGQEFRRLPSIAQTGRSILLPVNFPKAPNVETPEKALDANLQNLMAWDISPENPARLHAAGVRFAFTSFGLKKRGEFLNQVRIAVHRGLSPDVALAALTRVPAELFGVEDAVGSIERGKLASLIVTNGDLFSDETKIKETWVAGQRFQKQKTPGAEIAGGWKLVFGKNSVSIQVKQEPSTNGRYKYTATIKSDAKPTDADEKRSASQTLDHFTLVDTSVGGILDLESIGQTGIARFSFLLTTRDSDSATGIIVLPDGTRQPLVAKRIADVDSEQSNNDAKDEKADKHQPASFAVNYPLGAFGRTGIPNQPDAVLFKNVKVVWTSGPAGRLKETSVLVQNGKIKAIGKDLATPPSAIVVDATGMHLSPGIIDCHSHMATDGGVNESGQAITAEVRIGDFMNSDDITIYRQLAGGVTGSNILHGSANPIGGQNQVIKLRWGATGEGIKFKRAPAGIKFALGENVKQANWGDEFTTRYPQTRMGVEQIFRDEFQAAKEYAARHAAWQRDHRGLPPRRDLELDAIAEILDGKRWIHCHSYRQDEILALIRVLDDYGITIGTFQHILEGYKVADAMAKHGAMGSAFSDWWAYKFEVYDAIPFAGALMHHAGVVVSYNSDDRELGRHLNQEAAKAMKYGGLPPEDALKFVTLNPAKQLRIDQFTGSIEVGKDADLVLWNESPLSNYARPEQTWIDGRRYFDRSEDAEMRKQNAKMRATLIQKILSTGAKMVSDDEDENADDESHLWPSFDEFCSHAAGEKVKRRDFKK